jgi:hypothetical protein
MPDQTPPCPTCQVLGSAISVSATPGVLIVTYQCPACGTEWIIHRPSEAAFPSTPKTD